MLVWFLCGVPDAGATVTFSASTTGSTGLAASAAFTISGTTLTVLLTNTDTGLPVTPKAEEALLVGVFFNLGSGAFTPVSASVAASSLIQTGNCTVVACPSATTTDVGGEWGYKYSAVAFNADVAGANQAIATDTDLISSATAFPGTANYENPAGIGGIEFGIVPAIFTANQGDGPMDANTLIKGAATFVLTIPDGLSEDDITNVYFQYGEDFDDPTLGVGRTSTSGTTVATGPVPEPAALGLLGAALSVMAARLRRRGGRPRRSDPRRG